MKRFVYGLILMSTLNGAEAQQVKLSCILSLEDPVSKDVMVKFTLKNESNASLKILPWFTPLEGLLSDIFVITKDGIELEYQGPMVKRTAPAEADYILLDANDELSNLVPLASVYDFNQVGHYLIEFKGKLSEAIDESNERVYRHQTLDCGILELTR